MKKIYSYLPVIILFVIVIILVFKYLKIKDSYKELSLLDINKEQYLNSLANDIGKRRLFEISVNNHKIKGDYNFVNRQGKKVLLGTLINNNTLVFYFNSRACSSCLDKEIERLKDNDKLNNKVLVLTDFANLSDFYRIARTIHGNFNLLNLSKPLSFMQKNDLPIYFLLDRNMLITKSFIPNPDREKETDKYLDIISNYFSLK